MMTLASPGTSIATTPWRTGHVRIGQDTLRLDQGGVLIVNWTDEVSMGSDIQALDARLDITVRFVGGSLIADLCLHDNLILESALDDGSLSRHLLPEIDILFGNAGCPVNWPVWTELFPDTAPRDAVLQVRVGRALMADPDVLIIDAAQWDESLLSSQQFSRSFTMQYPWRTLVWATHDKARASSLQSVLKEFQA